MQRHTIPSVDYEQQARQLRAEAVAAMGAHLRRWLQARRAARSGVNAPARH